MKLRNVLLGACFAAALNAASVDPFYAGSYTAVTLGSVAGVLGNYGGITFLNNSTLLLGAHANNADATIQSVPVIRDLNGHIVGFGEASLFATAPNIDGGLAYGPGGVLFATGYSNNTLLQFKPGSTSPDRIDQLPAATNSTGTLQFVPAGYPGAGNFVIGSYTNSGWFTASLSPDGSGTYDIADLTFREQGGGGPEGIIYIPLGSPLFESPSVLVSEYSSNRIRAYLIDSFGIPVTSSGTTFIDGLGGAEGATIDPVTGDFLFSTFGAGNQIIQVQGFVAPPSAVPEPATFALAGVVLTGLAYRRRKR